MVGRAGKVIVGIIAEIVGAGVAGVRNNGVFVSWPVIGAADSVEPHMFVGTPVWGLSFRLSPAGQTRGGTPPGLPVVTAAVGVPRVARDSNIFDEPVSMHDPIRAGGDNEGDTGSASSAFSIVVLQGLVFPNVAAPTVGTPGETYGPGVSMG